MLTNEHSVYEILDWGPIYLLKTPLEKGRRWTCTEADSFYMRILGTMSIVSADTTFDDPIGRFEHVIFVRQESDFLTSKFFIAPGVGIILQVTTNAPDGGYARELIDWKVK